MFKSLASWLNGQHIDFQENALIAPFLCFKIGGKVNLLVICDSPAQMAAVLQKTINDKIPYLIIGGGSNIAFGDGLTKAAVIVYQGPLGKNVVARLIDGQSLQVGGGVKNQIFLSWCALHGVGGLEFLSGIPGTLGGAAAVNAGAFGKAMADVLLGADIVDEGGNIKVVDAAYFAFSYRNSRFRLGNEVILTLRLKFNSAEKTVISRKIRKNLDYRLSHHPSYRLPSAGCFFKNPIVQGAKRSAGKIIEECGLKNLTVGGLTVAAEHGNFLLNQGKATFAELLLMENEIKSTVVSRTGIVLEREVIYVSPDGIKH